MEQKAAGVHQRKDQRRFRVILTASKQDDRYCCRYFDARLSSSIKRALILKKVGLTVTPEALMQEKQAVTLKSTHRDAQFVNFKARAKGQHQLPESRPVSKQRELCPGERLHSQGTSRHHAKVEGTSLTKNADLNFHN